MEQSKEIAVWTAMAIVAVAGCSANFFPGDIPNEFPANDESVSSTNSSSDVTEYSIQNSRIASPGALRPGDLIDARMLRDDEPRLIRPLLFTEGMSAPGPGPRVVVQPPELNDFVGKNRFR